MPTSMILRFRDLVADTIPEHQELIKQHGYVWWGWWGKPNEMIPRSTFAQFREFIDRDRYISVFLLHSGEEQLFHGCLVEIDESRTETPKECPDPEKTPGYYRTARYKAWFRFTDIKPASPDEVRQWSYDEVVEFLDDPFSARFQDKRVFSIGEILNRRHRTIYFVKPYEEKHQDYNIEVLSSIPPANFVTKPITTGSNYIVHISDLHFSVGHHGFALDISEIRRKKLSQLISDDLRRSYNNVPPAIVVISGDLTWQGRAEEFEYVRNFVGELGSIFGLDPHHFLIIPGNHDIQWSDQDGTEYDREKRVEVPSDRAEENYRRFYKQVFGLAPNEFLSAGRRCILSNYTPLDIIGLNSSRLEQKHFAGYGYVSLEQVENAVETMEWSAQKPRTKYRILVLHHHAIPVTPKEEIANYDRIYSLTLDAGQLIYRAIQLGVDLIIHGHMC